MITPYLPYPLVSGGQIRTYNLLKILKNQHDITLISFIREEKEKKYLPQLKKFCREIYTFKKLKPFSLTNILKSGFTSYPGLMTMYLSGDVKYSITEILKKEKFDLIHAETFYVMSNILKTNIPKILVEQTIEYKVYQSFVSSINFLPLKKLLEFDVAKIKKWEKYYWMKADKIITMSEADRATMLSEIHDLKIEVVPNGVDVDDFSQIRDSHKKNNKTVLFVGNFKWIQNKEAVFFLHEKVWPLILQKCQSARLWVVGKNPSSEILAMASPNVQVEEIDDIKHAFSASNLLLAPMLSGGGTRYKILEAMASSTPVVSTTLGVEGLNVSHEKHVFIADTAEGLADLTVKILNDEKYGEQVIENAKQLIEEKYNWPKIAQKLNDIYREVGGEK